MCASPRAAGLPVAPGVGLRPRRRPPFRRVAHAGAEPRGRRAAAAAERGCLRRRLEATLGPSQPPGPPPAKPPAPRVKPPPGAPPAPAPDSPPAAPSPPLVAPPRASRELRLLVPLMLASGSATRSPAFSPLRINVELSPARPVVTERLSCLLPLSTVTEPPVIALVGTLTPSACSTTASAVALIPGFRPLCSWSSVNV